MKKILIVTAFAVLSVSMFAQVQFGLGAIVGAGTSGVNPNVTVPQGIGLSVPEPAFSWSAGIKADATFNPHFAVESNILLTSIGYSTAFTPSAISGAPSSPKGSVTTVNSGTTIELNLLARPQLPIGDSAIYLLVGIGYQGELGKGQAVTKKGTEDLAKLPGTDKDKEPVKNTVPYQALTLPMGLGFQLPAGPGMISIDGRISFPYAISVNKKGETPSIWSNFVGTIDGVYSMVLIETAKFTVGYTYLF